MIVNKFYPDYKKAYRKQKTEILNQLQELTKMDRKYLIKLLREKRSLASFQSVGRPKVYDPQIYRHISTLHRLMEQISPKRMKVAMPLWLPFYEKHYGNLDGNIHKQFLAINSSTIGRILKQLRDQMKGKSTTKPNHRLKLMIQLKRLDEKVTAPGTVQADTVVNCG